MSSPDVSVVIPCYNAERYIGATLHSVLTQDGPSLEIIVVDDESTDGSAEFVLRHFPQVRLLQQRNQGAGAARNLGIKHARADHVAFVDADDLWLPGKLQAQWSLMQQRPDARMVYSAWQVWCSDDKEPTASELQRLLAGAHDPERWQGPSGWLYAELLLDCVVWTSTVLAQRSLLEEAGLFDASLRIGEDYDLWLRASRLTPILRLPTPHALYRMHASNTTRRAPSANFSGLVVERALERWGRSGPDGSTARDSDVRRALARSWSSYAGAHLAVGNAGQARAGSLQALRRDWRHVPGWKSLIKACMLSVQPQPARSPAR